MSFFPFGSGWMLLWGLAAAIPIIIHLWNRRRYQEMAWAAMEYLLAAMKKNSRRITVEQLILLLIRVAILLALAVALADPLLPNAPTFAPGLGAGGQTHWVLVFDGSYSMDYKRSDETRFEVAKDLAAQLVDESTQGDGFTLVMMSDPPQVVIRRPAFAREDVLEEIDNLELPHGGASLSSTLAEVEKIVQAADERHPRLVHRKVCIFTDLGRTTWDAVDSTECRTRVTSLSERASLVLFDLGDSDQTNLAVTQLELLDSLMTIGRDARFQVEVQNFGAQQATGQTVELLVDGQRVDDQQVDVPANGRAAATFTHRFTAPGEHHIEVRVQGDPLSVDNHRWLSVPVRESISALCVEGKAGAAKHVGVALEPSKSNRPRVTPKVAGENAILEENLNEFDCVLVCNVGRFGSDEAAVLHEYLASGGGVVFFLGDLVQADSYNEYLVDNKKGKRVLPVRLESVVGDRKHQFNPLEYRHSIAAPFRGHPKSGLINTPVWRYIHLKPVDKTTSEIAMTFDTADPAIVEEKIGRGQVIVYASAVSGKSFDRLTDPPTQWTEFHTWPSFVPLVQEMLSLAVRGRTADRTILVGEDIQGVAHDTLGDVPLKIVKPSGREESVKMSVDGEDSRWIYGRTWQSGIYEAQIGKSQSDTRYYAVNVNTRESNLERFDAELLPSQFQSDYKIDDLEKPQLPSTNRSQLFQYVLVLVLLLLFCESFLAYHFGRARGASV